MKYDDTQLKALVERLSLSRFAKPFNHEAKYNPYLKITGGRVVFPTIRKRVIEDKIHMEINPKLKGDDLEGVILHELTHYHLYFKKGLHRENDPEFRQILRDLNAPIHSPLHRSQKSFYVYQCVAPAHHQYSRNRKIDTKKMRCGFDRAKLELISETHL